MAEKSADEIFAEIVFAEIVFVLIKVEKFLRNRIRSWLIVWIMVWFEIRMLQSLLEWKVWRQATDPRVARFGTTERRELPIQSSGIFRQ